MNVLLFHLWIFTFSCVVIFVCQKWMLHAWTNGRTCKPRLSYLMFGKHSVEVIQELRRKKILSPWRGSSQCSFQSSAFFCLQINVVTKLGVELDLQIAQQLLYRWHPLLKAFDLLLQSFLRTRYGNFSNTTRDTQQVQGIFLNLCCFTTTTTKKIMHVKKHRKSDKDTNQNANMHFNVRRIMLCGYLKMSYSHYNRRRVLRATA